MDDPTALSQLILRVQKLRYSENETREQLLKEIEQQLGADHPRLKSIQFEPISTPATVEHRQEAFLRGKKELTDLLTNMERMSFVHDALVQAGEKIELDHDVADLKNARVEHRDWLKSHDALIKHNLDALWKRDDDYRNALLEEIKNQGEHFSKSLAQLESRIQSIEKDAATKAIKRQTVFRFTIAPLFFLIVEGLLLWIIDLFGEGKNLLQKVENTSSVFFGVTVIVSIIVTIILGKERVKQSKFLGAIFARVLPKDD